MTVVRVFPVMHQANPKAEINWYRGEIVARDLSRLDMYLCLSLYVIHGMSETDATGHHFTTYVRSTWPCHKLDISRIWR